MKQIDRPKTRDSEPGSEFPACGASPQVASAVVFHPAGCLKVCHKNQDRDLYLPLGFLLPPSMIHIVSHPASAAFQLESALPGDLAELLALEATAFTAERRESAACIRRSLRSPTQEVWVYRSGTSVVATATFRLHPKSLRVYSIAVRPDHRGCGLGVGLMQQAICRAVSLQKIRLILELDEQNTRLQTWYKGLGFHSPTLLKDFYAPGWNGIRMTRNISDQDQQRYNPTHA
jgi:ribosomal protein S18 acetylase RimI-like enzyme